jgi:hypothetical protein
MITFTVVGPPYTHEDKRATHTHGTSMNMHTASGGEQRDFDWSRRRRRSTEAGQPQRIRAPLLRTFASCSNRTVPAISLDLSTATARTVAELDMMERRSGRAERNGESAESGSGQRRRVMVRCTRAPSAVDSCVRIMPLPCRSLGACMHGDAMRCDVMRCDALTLDRMNARAARRESWTSKRRLLNPPEPFQTNQQCSHWRRARTIGAFAGLQANDANKCSLVIHTLRCEVCCHAR